MMNRSPRDWRPAVAYAVGAVEALLLARLVLRLFAARPDNPVFRALFGLSAPLTAPLAFLDAGQPRFGAVLEFSAVVCILLLPALGAVVWLMMRRWAPPR